MEYSPNNISMGCNEHNFTSNGDKGARCSQKQHGRLLLYQIKKHPKLIVRIIMKMILFLKVGLRDCFQFT